MSNNEDILNNYEPALCFDKVKHGRGRPRLKINSSGMAVITALAHVMCTEEEIAACLDTTVETLHSEINEPIFSECYKKGAQEGKMSLRRMQFELAKSSATMAIWLGKQMLSQRDNPEEQEQDGKVNVVINLADTSGESKECESV